MFVCLFFLCKSCFVFCQFLLTFIEHERLRLKRKSKCADLLIKITAVKFVRRKKKNRFNDKAVDKTQLLNQLCRT